MDATRQFLWTLLVLAAGFFCMAMRALVDASPSQAAALDDFARPHAGISVAYAAR